MQVCVPVDNGWPPSGTSCSVHYIKTRVHIHHTHTHQRINTCTLDVHACFSAGRVTRAQFSHSRVFTLHRGVRGWEGPGRWFLSVVKAWAMKGWLLPTLVLLWPPSATCGTQGHACPFQLPPALKPESSSDPPNPTPTPNPAPSSLKHGTISLPTVGKRVPTTMSCHCKSLTVSLRIFIKSALHKHTSWCWTRHASPVNWTVSTTTLLRRAVALLMLLPH